ALRRGRLPLAVARAALGAGDRAHRGRRRPRRRGGPRGARARLSVALVSGAASGIGAAIARRLGQDGPVVALDRDPAVQELGAALPLVADVTEPGAAEAAVAAAGSSFGGLVGGPRAVSYAATKAAVVNLTRALAIDHGPEGVRVNCVCPGDTDTPMLRDELAQLGEDVSAGLASSASVRPLRRLGTPEDVAAAVAWLSSEEARYVTGTTLVVDGGGLAGG